MGELISLPTIQKWEDKLKNVRFKLKKLSLYNDKQATVKEYAFIVLEHTLTKRFKTTGYSHYFFLELNKSRYGTWEFHGKIIVSFLNYVFIDNYKEYKISSIVDITLQHGTDFLIDYKNGHIGRETKTQSTMEKIENVIRVFYKYLADNCKGMKYIKKDVKVKFAVVYDENVIAPDRIKDL